MLLMREKIVVDDRCWWAGGGARAAALRAEMEESGVVEALVGVYADPLWADNREVLLNTTSSLAHFVLDLGTPPTHLRLPWSGSPARLPTTRTSHHPATTGHHHRPPSTGHQQRRIPRPGANLAHARGGGAHHLPTYLPIYLSISCVGKGPGRAAREFPSGRLTNIVPFLITGFADVKVELVKCLSHILQSGTQP